MSQSACDLNTQSKRNLVYGLNMLFRFGNGGHFCWWEISPYECKLTADEKPVSRCPMALILWRIWELSYN